MTESQIAFNNWCKDLEVRLLTFQVNTTKETEGQYWAHRNCVMYDYEIHRLRKFNNPCRSCGIPLHLTNNFEAFLYGPVCGLCYAMRTAIADNKYFYELHRKWRTEQNKKNPGDTLTA